jgi:drug/metabolite transporter (DMT)-like permease
LLTIYVVWGSTFIALAIAVRDLPPFLAMTIRHLFAGALLLAWALPRGDRESDPIGRRQVVAGFVFGGLLFLLSHGSLAWAQQTVPAGVAALLVGSIPIWMALLDRVVFGKRLRSSAYAGFALGFAGLAFLIDPFGEGHVDRVGAIVIVLGALTWAAGSLYSRSVRRCPSGRSSPPALARSAVAFSSSSSRLHPVSWARRPGPRSPCSRSRTSSWLGAWSASLPTSGSCGWRRCRWSPRTRT